MMRGKLSLGLLAAVIVGTGLGVNMAPIGLDAAQAAQPASAYRFERHGDFKVFFEDFRKAVLANDREAVAQMTQLPFTDFRAGYYCEAGDKDCTVPKDALTSRSKAEFLAKYDLIFTPEVIKAIGERKLRGYENDDKGESPGPLAKGEYLLNPDDIDLQRVFASKGGRYRMVRVPFYS